MRIETTQINSYNERLRDTHDREFSRLKESLKEKGIQTDSILKKLSDFQVAIPSWALGAGGTRFGRFPFGGEPGNLTQKIEDVGLLHALNRSSGAISLHIPWDIPEDLEHIRQLASEHGLTFDAVNSNTFQDQKNQTHSYKFGSLSHTDKAVRNQAIRHNIDVINYGKGLGSRALTVWLADGSNFPGQQNMRGAFSRTLDSLEQIASELPDDWTMLIEYKPFEPNFYSMVIPDWGTSFLLASKLGKQAATLVDLGHHLPNTNIEQIVAILSLEEKLGGFHFNDSKYADDDLTTGSIKPYQLFLIFCELAESMENGQADPSWMIDASHNVKDPLEDLLQSVDAIKTAYAKALLVDRTDLHKAQEANDPAMAQEVLKRAFQMNVSPLLKESMLQRGGALDPLGLFRDLKVRETLINERGSDSVATGL